MFARSEKRIALAKDAFNRMKSIIKDKDISMNTKIRIMKTYLRLGWASTVKNLIPCLSEGIGRKITNSVMTQNDFPAQINQFLGRKSNLTNIMNG